jgi:flagellar hook-associated protein 3 FlgL
MRRELVSFEAIIDTNGTAQTRLDSTLASMGNLTGQAEALVSTLLAARSTETGPAIAEDEAKAFLNALIDTLNSSTSGEFLFAGINTDTQPLASYFTDPTSDAKTATDDAFLAFFGSTQSNPDNVNTITATQMQDFLDEDYFGDNFTTLFDDTNWETNWSSSSSQNVESRITTNDTIETSSNANFSGYRKLAQAYTMVADLGVENLSRGTFEVVVDKAVQLTSEGIQELAEEQGRLGTALSRISNANDRMRVQVDILTTQINELETVDPYDAATRVTTLLTQMETAYSLTARIQNLSLMKYL